MDGAPVIAPVQPILSLCRYRKCWDGFREPRHSHMQTVGAKRMDSLRPAALLLLILCGAAGLLAQNSVLRGVVTDESGAVVPGVAVGLTGPGGFEKTATTGGDGVYTFAGLVPGDYPVQASAPPLLPPP